MKMLAKLSLAIKGVPKYNLGTREKAPEEPGERAGLDRLTFGEQFNEGFAVK
jgi:hypothetical protein